MIDWTGIGACLGLFSKAPMAAVRPVPGPYPSGSMNRKLAAAKQYLKERQKT